MKRFVPPLVLLVCAYSTGPAHATKTDPAPDRWEARIQVSDGHTNTSIALGMQDSAGDDFDRLWDVKALFGAGVRAWFYHPGWPEGAYYVRDVRDGAFPEEYTFYVSRARYGATVTLSWDLRHVAAGCERVDLLLTDAETGQTVDLRRTREYQYVSTQSAPRVFRVEARLTEAARGPAAPSGRQALKAGKSGRTVVQWKAPRSGELPVAYNVYRADAAGLTRCNDLPVYNTTFHDFSIAPGTAGASYRVRSLNRELCEGPDSDPIPLRVTGE